MESEEVKEILEEYWELKNGHGFARSRAISRVARNRQVAFHVIEKLIYAEENLSRNKKK